MRETFTINTHTLRTGLRWLVSIAVVMAALATASGVQASTAPKLSKLIRDAAAAEADQTKYLNVIVLPAPGVSVASAALAVQEADGKAEPDTLSSGAVTAQVRINKLDKLAADPRVQAVLPNLPVAPTDSSVTTFAAPTDYAALVNAPQAWAQGFDGRGVGIAVIDSGVAQVPDFGTRLIRVSLPGQTDSLEDTHGHGSMVAGVAAGAPASGVYRGIAPGATVYALKVRSDEQGVRSSDLIQAVDWVTLRAKQLNIRVVVLSVSEMAPSSYRGSLLDASLEHAWRNGVVVVVAAGNLGPNSQYFAPSNDPFVISVGALDADGVSPTSFSSYGTTPDGYHRPDVYAPGRHITTLLAPGSHLASQAPLSNVVSPGYAYASGTSLAAPQVAGAAAILLQQRPTLTPNEVKWLLMSSGRAVAAGKALDVGAAVAYAGTVGKANQGVPVGNCSAPVPCSTPGSAYLAFFDWALAESSNQTAYEAGAAWNGASWNGASWNGASWNGASWNGASWNGASWNGASWN